MEATTSAMQHSYGLGPRGPNPPHGVQQQVHGPQQPAPGPAGAPRPEDQHHHQQQQQQQQQQQHKPLFYIQPSQQYLPMQSLQWPLPVPMPMSYNPYYGYPGLGYGMQMMPNYQLNPYMEPPGFVVPHTHLHLMDYRRMLNPQYYQTMAYHSRRFRYQHNSQAREMTSSEVQTEPLAVNQRTSTPGSNAVEGPRGLSLGSPGVSANQQPSPASALQQGDLSLELKDAAPSSAARTPPNGGFVIQTEEVRIECCTTPVGLQLLHSHETAEVSHSFSQDVVQCSSILQGRVLQDEGVHLPADQAEQALQACPDILLVGTPSSGEKISAPEESGNQTSPMTVAAHGDDVRETSSEDEDPSTTSTNFHFKSLQVANLPFDPEYLDELRKMESTVWSVEETLIPSPESLIQSQPQDEALAKVAEVPSTDVLTARDEAGEEVVPVIEMPPLTEDELEDVVPTAEDPGDEMLSEADMCPIMEVPVAEEAAETKTTYPTEVAHEPYLLMLDKTPLKADRSQHGRETTVQDHQDTSFESLPAYLPSSSWLADFDHIYYCSKMPPPTPKKQNRPQSSHGLDVPSRRRKLDLEYKDHHPIVRKPKERYKPKGKVDRRSLSDHECCLNRNYNENAFTPFVSKRERLCTRCLAKRKTCTSAGSGPNGPPGKRKAVPFQQRNDALLPTCEACKSHSKIPLVRKGSSPDLPVRRHGHDTEGESSENGSSRTGSKWRSANDPRKLGDLKKLLEKCPAAANPKKNCTCIEPQHPVARERLRHCPHGNAIRETDENCAVPVPLQDKWRNVDYTYLTHRWQTEKSWKSVIPHPDGTRAQHFNKHKKSQPHSQGTQRKDTRC